MRFRKKRKKVSKIKPMLIGGLYIEDFGKIQPNANV